MKSVYDIFVESLDTSSTITEAKISSDKEFEDYATNVLKKAHGSNYAQAVATQFISDLLKNAKGNYGTAVGILKASLGI